MPEYLLTGRDAKGRTTTERVEAGSADDAVMIARGALGLSDVVLHTDDVGALYQRQKNVAAVISPRDYLRFRELPAPVVTVLIVAKAAYLRFWPVTLLLLGLIIARRWSGTPWGLSDWLLTLLLLEPVVVALVIQLLPNRANRYRRLSDAEAWGRWEEVLRRCEALKGSKVPPEALAFHRAKALARLGRLEEGLAVVAPFGDGAAMPEWLFLSRTPEVYVAARRLDDAHAAWKRAVEAAPENPAVLIGAARFEIRRRRDPRRARELLERARTHALSDLLDVFARATEGEIAHAEGRRREAVDLLGDAHRRLSAFRHGHPSTRAALDYVKAELALALAAAGDSDKALSHARAALPRLRAQESDDLIDRLRSALGPAIDA